MKKDAGADQTVSDAILPEHGGIARSATVAMCSLLSMIKAMRLSGAMDACTVKRIAEQLEATARETGLDEESVRELQALGQSVRRMAQRGWMSHSTISGGPCSPGDVSLAACTERTVA